MAGKNLKELTVYLAFVHATEDSCHKLPAKLLFLQMLHRCSLQELMDAGRVSSIFIRFMFLRVYRSV